MNMPALIKETKRLMRSDKEKFVLETVKDLNEFDELEDAIDVIKSKKEEKLDWQEVF